LTRTPGGHPEGYLEAFANIYAEAASAIRSHNAEGSVSGDVHFPTVQDGLKGVKFFEACVKSSQKMPRGWPFERESSVIGWWVLTGSQSSPRGWAISLG
jgi:hypothetical protein